MADWMAGVRDRTASMEVAAEGAAPSPKQRRQAGQEEDREAEGGGGVQVRLMRQLEARIRTLEFETRQVYFFKADAPVAVAVAEARKTYDKLVKRDGVGHKHGSPHLHCLLAMVGAMVEFDEKGLPQDMMKLKGVAQRIMGFVTGQLGEVTELWAKECELSPTFDKAKVRLTVDMRGHMVVGVEVADGATPLVLPLPMPTRGEIIDLKAIVHCILRGMGGEVKSGRAPRGNLARVLSKR